MRVDMKYVLGHWGSVVNVVLANEHITPTASHHSSLGWVVCA